MIIETIGDVMGKQKRIFVKIMAKQKPDFADRDKILERGFHT